MTHILLFLMSASSVLERRYASPVTPASTSLAKRSGILSLFYNFILFIYLICFFSYCSFVFLSDFGARFYNIPLEEIYIYNNRYKYNVYRSVSIDTLDFDKDWGILSYRRYYTTLVSKRTPPPQSGIGGLNQKAPKHEFLSVEIS